MNIIKSLYLFQKERFPLQILLFTTLSSVLASVAVIDNSVNPFQIVSAFVITMLFLFHIRVIDESRDFKNDATLHPDRPVQRGDIALKQLFIVSIVGLTLSLALAWYFGFPSLLLALLFIAFTTLAWRDFFIPSLFTNRLVIYHLINSPQMILIQWFIFAIYTGSFRITFPMLMYMALIYINIFILEMVRKIKAPEKDTPDTYSANLGIKKTVFFLSVLTIISYVLYFVIIKYNQSQIPLYLILGALITLVLIVPIILFLQHPKIKLQKLCELGAVILYLFMNIFIFLTNN